LYSVGSIVTVSGWRWLVCPARLWFFHSERMVRAIVRLFCLGWVHIQRTVQSIFTLFSINGA
jgi:hypothetical protein